VIDMHGKRHIDAAASLSCESLGFSDSRLAVAGSRALETPPVYRTFNHHSNPYAARVAPFA
jgi:4-aminobutyrate--pyruvate transaminase